MAGTPTDAPPPAPATHTAAAPSATAPVISTPAAAASTPPTASAAARHGTPSASARSASASTPTPPPSLASLNMKDSSSTTVPPPPAAATSTPTSTPTTPAAILASGTKKRAGRGAGAAAAQGKRKAMKLAVKEAGEGEGFDTTKDAAHKGVPNAPVLVPESMASAAQYSRLDDSDTAEARALGLLNATIEVGGDPASSEYGVAYEKRGGSKAAGCGTDVFPSQKALQERCKQFAMERGFQLYVAGSSSRADGGGNVKYRCKKLHGQQFFDPNTPVDQLQCPFYINGFGLGPAWKITRACFLHNHYKFIGSRLHMSGGGSGSGVPGGEPSDELLGDGDSGKPRPQRNTTLSTNVLCRMVNEELDKYPSSAIAMSKLDGKLIKRILLSRGHTINHMMASRIKRQIQMNRIKSIRSSFQRLKSYFDLIVEKNPATKYLFHVDERGAFQRAMVLPAPTMHAMAYCQKVMAFDRIRPMLWGEMETKNGIPDAVEEESDDAVSGVYLYASTKDHNDQVVVFAAALVTVENQENWTWFLSTIQSSHNLSMAGGWNEYTVFAGRTNGLQQAVHTVWPHASHHLCVRRLVEEELVMNKKLPLPDDKKQRIYDLARCESEAEYKHIRQELALTNEAVVNFLDSLNRPSWVKYAFLEAFKKPTYGVVSSDLSSYDDCKQTGPGVASTGKGGSSHNQSAATVASPPSSMPLLKQWFGDELPRSSQPLVVFNRYFMKIAENFHARRKSVEQRPLPELVPKRFNQLEQILQGSQRCESVPCSNGTFMVRSLAQLTAPSHDTWRHVNLLDWECTCLEWQDRLFPCVHGIHAAELNRRRIDSLYNAKVFSVEHYKTCYEVGFTPWPVESATLTVDEALTIPLEDLYVQDPNIKRKPGPRPKMKKQPSSVV